MDDTTRVQDVGWNKVFKYDMIWSKAAYLNYNLADFSKCSIVIKVIRSESLQVVSDLVISSPSQGKPSCRDQGRRWHPLL
jgi:hypothetical protein